MNFEMYFLDLAPFRDIGAQPTTSEWRSLAHLEVGPSGRVFSAPTI